jgi:RNA polymerase sigma-70 factor (ECF subfamily)
VVELNRVVAVSFATSASEGLRVLRPLLAEASLRNYQPLHAAHADLLRRVGDRADAEAAYRTAIALSDNRMERAELTRRLTRLADEEPSG